MGPVAEVWTKGVRCWHEAYCRCVTNVLHDFCGGEWLQILRLGQFRDQGLWILDKHPLLPGSGTKVQVQATLEAFIDVSVIGWHLQ